MNTRRFSPVSGLLCAFLLMLSLLAAVAWSQDASKPNARTGKRYFQVYFEENFKGRAVRVEAPCELANSGMLKKAGIANDSIMSMKIPEGVTVTVYDADGFSGPSKSFTGHVPTLGDLKARTSSLKAEVK